MTDFRRASVLAAVRLSVIGARPDTVEAAFASAGVDTNDPEQLRAVVQLSTCLRMGVEPSPSALALLGVAS